jgi:hypothetical protein
MPRLGTNLVQVTLDQRRESLDPEQSLAEALKIADQGRPGDRWLIDTVRFDEAVHKASRPKSSSQVTLCWREMDSNHRYPAKFFLAAQSLPRR